LVSSQQYEWIRTIWKIYKEARIPGFFLASLWILNSKNDVLLQSNALVLSATLASLHGILQTLSGNPYFLIPTTFLSWAQVADELIGFGRHFLPGSTVVRAHSFHLFHNVFAGLLIFSIANTLAPLIVVKENSLAKRRFYFLLALLQAVGLLVTFSRGAWMSLIGAWSLAFFVLGLVRYKRFLKSGIVTVLLVSVVICLFAFVFPQAVSQRFTTLLRPTEQSELWFRVARWQAALQVVKDYPLLGTGLLNLGDIASELVSGATPHNGYLFIATSRGIPALVCFLIVLLFSIRKSAQFFYQQDKNLKVLGLAAMTGLVGFALHNLLDATIGDFAIGSLFWWTAGCIFAIKSPH
jgi:O-antigen ligase